MTPAVIIFGVAAALTIVWLVRNAASQPVEDFDDEVAEESGLDPFRTGHGWEWFRNCPETRLFAWQIALAKHPHEAEDYRRMLPYLIGDSMRALGEFIAGGYVEPTYLDPEDHPASDMAREDEEDALDAAEVA